MLQRFLQFTALLIERRAALMAGTVRRGCARTLGQRLRGDTGMSTAEYAIGTIAACAFAALLYKVITSTQILQLLTGLVTRALQVPF